MRRKRRVSLAVLVAVGPLSRHTHTVSWPNSRLSRAYLYGVLTTAIVDDLKTATELTGKAMELVRAAASDYKRVMAEPQLATISPQVS